MEGGRVVGGLGGAGGARPPRGGGGPGPLQDRPPARDPDRVAADKAKAKLKGYHSVEAAEQALNRMLQWGGQIQAQANQTGEIAHKVGVVTGILKGVLTAVAAIAVVAASIATLGAFAGVVGVATALVVGLSLHKLEGIAMQKIGLESGDQPHQELQKLGNSLLGKTRVGYSQPKLTPLFTQYRFGQVVSRPPDNPAHINHKLGRQVNEEGIEHGDTVWFATQAVDDGQVSLHYQQKGAGQAQHHQMSKADFELWLRGLTVPGLELDAKDPKVKYGDQSVEPKGMNVETDFFDSTQLDLPDFLAGKIQPPVTTAFVGQPKLDGGGFELVYKRAEGDPVAVDVTEEEFKAWKAGGDLVTIPFKYGDRGVLHVKGPKEPDSVMPWQAPAVPMPPGGAPPGGDVGELARLADQGGLAGAAGQGEGARFNGFPAGLAEPNDDLAARQKMRQAGVPIAEDATLEDCANAYLLGKEHILGGGDQLPGLLPPGQNEGFVLVRNGDLCQAYRLTREEGGDLAQVEALGDPVARAALLSYDFPDDLFIAPQRLLEEGD